MDYRLPPYRPNLKQALFHADTSTFKLFLGGVGSGKTHAGARELVLSALENGPGHRYIVGAPSEKIMRSATWEHYAKFCRQCARHSGRKFARKMRISPQNRSIILNGDITIEFVLLKDPDAFAGPTISGFHIDEAGLLPSGMKAWEVMLERHREKTARRLFGVVTTTPRGPVGIVQHFIEQCRWNNKLELMGPGRNADYAMYASSTWENQSNLADGYIRRQLVGKSKRQVDQQLRARVLDFDGAVYAGQFDNIGSLARGWDASRDLEEKAIYLAIDWGPNYPHVLWIAHDRDKDFDVVFGEYCEDRVPHRLLMERAIKMGKQRWGLEKKRYAGVYCDYNPEFAVRTARSFFGARDSRQRVPVFAKVVGNELRDGVDVVGARLCDHADKRRLFFAPDLDRTQSRRRILQCMRLYQWPERDRGGVTQIEDLRPLKNGMDHGPDALRYYCWQRYKFDGPREAWATA